MTSPIVKMDRGQQQNGEECGREPLQVDSGGDQERLDAHVLSATPYGASETVPSLGFAMDALDPPPMPPIEIVFILAPSEPFASRPK
jgi:hypothetical protein